MKYEIIYSGRRTLSLCVKEGKLIVRAPYGTKHNKIDEAVASHKDWAEKHIEKQMARNKKYQGLTEENIKALRKKAKQTLREKADYYSNIMGIKYGRITITGAKTRFGSCSSKGDLSFSYRLMLYPEEAVDYVVVHELAHIIELNHSPAFYRIVESVMPDYKERRKLLKK